MEREIERERSPDEDGDEGNHPVLELGGVVVQGHQCLPFVHKLQTTTTTLSRVQNPNLSRRLGVNQL